MRRLLLLVLTLALFLSTTFVAFAELEKKGAPDKTERVREVKEEKAPPSPQPPRVGDDDDDDDDQGEDNDDQGEDAGFRRVWPRRG
jgi:hypothetical protein